MKPSHPGGVVSSPTRATALQAHCTREKSPMFGVWKQDLLLQVDAVLRQCGASYPLPASVMYNSTQTELHRIESAWAAEPQDLNGRALPRAGAKR